MARHALPRKIFGYHCPLPDPEGQNDGKMQDFAKVIPSK